MLEVSLKPYTQDWYVNMRYEQPYFYINVEHR